MLRVIWTYLQVCRQQLLYFSYKQGIHKRMVRFKKQIISFLDLHGHNIHCRQRELFTFLMRYQQFASHAYCGAAGPLSKMASQREKAFWVLGFEASKSMITVQREFRARFQKDAPHKNNVNNQIRKTVILVLLIALKGTTDCPTKTWQS
jgi:hypothetical protein